MNTKTTFFIFNISIHLFNGCVFEANGFGVIHTESDKNRLLTEETFTSLIRLAQILRPIYMRMLEKGYNINNEKLVKNEQKI